MSVKYYEITDSQWEQIKALFLVAKTEPSNIAALCTIQKRTQSFIRL